MSERLPPAQWREVVERTPLVSIDLIVRDAENRVLLGLRRNAPARGTWFVPGGVIRKNETLDAAYERVSRDELGQPLRRSDATFRGVHEHHYPDNFADAPGFGTHYVVLPYELHAPESLTPPDEQHRDYRWFSVAQLLADPQVHRNTQDYFAGIAA